MTTKILRDKILSSDDRKYEDIEVPEWDCKVRIRETSAQERELFEKRVGMAGTDPAKMAQQLGDLRVSLVVKCLFDPMTNERLFSDEDKKALNEKSAAVIQRLFTHCMRISTISQEVVEAAVGESETIPAEGSS